MEVLKSIYPLHAAQNFAQSTGSSSAVVQTVFFFGAHLTDKRVHQLQKTVRGTRGYSADGTLSELRRLGWQGRGL